MEAITLSPRQQRRAEVLTRLVGGKLTVEQAADLMGCSARTVRRRLSRYRQEGLKSIVHGNAGRSPLHKTGCATVARIKELTGENGRYRTFNVNHLSEMLRLHEDIQIGRSTLDRLLKQEAIRKPRKSGGPPVRRRRERYPREGELLQIDGSLHDWLRSRGPKMCLLGGIDDATSKIVSLVFRPTEDQVGYLLLMRTIATDPRYGLPMAFYHDKHTILRSPKQATIDDELAGREPMSQIQEVLHRLGVESISAHSPQAKGRVERMWQTLQDRLINEMDVADISSMEEANAFLPGFINRWNAQFTCDPLDPEPAWVVLEMETDLAYLFAAWKTRTVRADHTFCWRGKTLLIDRRKTEPSLAGQRVQVHTTPEAELYIYLGKRRLSYTQVASRPEVVRLERTPNAPISKTSVPYNPAPNLRRKLWLHGNPAAI
jgi:transposase